MKTKQSIILLLSLTTLMFLGCKQPTVGGNNAKDTTLRMAAKIYLGPPSSRLVAEKILTVTIGKDIVLPVSVRLIMTILSISR